MAQGCSKGGFLFRQKKKEGGTMVKNEPKKRTKRAGREPSRN